MSRVFRAKVDPKLLKADANGNTMFQSFVSKTTTVQRTEEWKGFNKLFVLAFEGQAQSAMSVGAGYGVPDTNASIKKKASNVSRKSRAKTFSRPNASYVLSRFYCIRSWYRDTFPEMPL